MAARLRARSAAATRGGASGAYSRQRSELREHREDGRVLAWFSASQTELVSRQKEPAREVLAASEDERLALQPFEPLPLDLDARADRWLLQGRLTQILRVKRLRRGGSERALDSRQVCVAAGSELREAEDAASEPDAKAPEVKAGETTTLHVESSAVEQSSAQIAAQQRVERRMSLSLTVARSVPRRVISKAAQMSKLCAPSHAAEHARRESSASGGGPESTASWLGFLATLPPVPYDVSIMSRHLAESLPLQYACYLDVNGPTSGTKSTMLHSAVWFRKVQMVRLLLDFGADPNHQNLKGNTPMHYACEHCAQGKDQCETLLLLLLAFDGDLTVRNKTEGRAPIDIFADAARFEERGRALSLQRRRWAGANPVRVWGVTREQLEFRGDRLRERSAEEVAANRERAAQVFEQLKHMAEKQTTAASDPCDGIPLEEPKHSGWGARPVQGTTPDATGEKVAAGKSETRASGPPEAPTDERGASRSRPTSIWRHSRSASLAARGFPQWLARLPHFREAAQRSRENRALQILEDANPHERTPAQLDDLVGLFKKGRVAFLRDLPAPLLREVLSTVKVQRVARNSMVYRWDWVGAQFFILVEGSVRLWRRPALCTLLPRARSGLNECAVAVGECFGHDRFFDPQLRRKELWKKLVESLRARRARTRGFEEREGAAALRRLEGVVAQVLATTRFEDAVCESDSTLLVIDHSIFRAMQCAFAKMQRNAIIEFLHTTELCRTWNYERLRRLTNCIEMREFARGHVIARQGLPMDSMAFVMEGEVQLRREVEVTTSTRCPIGRKRWQIDQVNRLFGVPVELRGVRALFGEEMLARCPRRDFTAVAATPAVKVLLVPLRHRWQFSLDDVDVLLLEEKLARVRLRAAQTVREWLAAKFPHSHTKNPFPVIVWSNDQRTRAASELQPIFRALQPGCVHVNFDPQLAGLAPQQAEAERFDSQANLGENGARGMGSTRRQQLLTDKSALEEYEENRALNQRTLKALQTERSPRGASRMATACRRSSLYALAPTAPSPPSPPSPRAHAATTTLGFRFQTLPSPETQPPPLSPPQPPQSPATRRRRSSVVDVPPSALRVIIPAEPGAAMGGECEARAAPPPASVAPTSAQALSDFERRSALPVGALTSVSALHSELAAAASEGRAAEVNRRRMSIVVDASLAPSAAAPASPSPSSRAISPANAPAHVSGRRRMSFVAEAAW